MKIKTPWKLIIFFALIVIGIGIVTAIEFTPQGNINLRDRYNITGLNYLGGFKLFGNINASGYNITNGGTYSADRFIGDGSQLTGIPGGNASWNQSLADAIYYSKTQNLNGQNIYKIFNFTEINRVYYVQPNNHSDIQVKVNLARDAGGGRVHIPAGLYLANASIILYNNTILEGDGWNTIIKLKDNWTTNPTINTPGLIQVYLGNHHIMIKDLQLDGNAPNNLLANHSGHGGFGIDTTYNNNAPLGYDVIIYNVKAGNTLRSVISPRDRVYIDNCELYDGWFDHIVYFSNSRDSSLVNSRIHGAFQIGAIVTATQYNVIGDRIIIANNHFYNFTNNTLDPSSAATRDYVATFRDGTHGLVFTGNIIDYSSGEAENIFQNGVILDDSNDSILSNNIFIGSADGSSYYHGIINSRKNSNHLIIGNHFKGANLYSAAINIIVGPTWNQKNYIVTGNMIEEDTNYQGVRVYFGESCGLANCTITNVQITNNLVEASVNPIAIVGSGNINGLLIQGNQLSESSSDRIKTYPSIQNISGLIIDENPFINAIDYGNASLTNLRLNWSFVTNFPGACPSGTFLTQIGTTMSCAIPNSSAVVNTQGVSGEGLILYLPLDSNLNDYSGKGSITVNKSGSLIYTSAKKGSGFYSDNNPYLLTTLNQNITSNVTVCVWNQPTQLQNSLSIISTRHGDTGSGNWGFVFRRHGISSQMGIGIFNGSNDMVNNAYNLPSKFNNTDMQLWCFTVNGTKVTGFINGENVTPEISISGPMAPAPTVGIGISFFGSTTKYNGTIDEVLIWNRSLSISELKSLYESNTQFPPLEAFHLKGSELNPTSNGSNSIGSATLRWLKGWFLGLDVQGDVNISGNVNFNNSNLTGIYNISVANPPAEWLSTYNSTYATWSYNQTSGAINDINGRFWNKTQSYNKTEIDNMNSTWSSTYNSTYATWSYNQTTPAINDINSRFWNRTQAYNKTEIDNMNSTWSSTYNSTYATWSYNQTTPAINDINSRFWNKTQSYNKTQIDAMNSTWSSTYNSTYNTWAYNQTIPANSYTDTRVGTANLHQHDSTNITNIPSSWLTTFNSTYDAFVTANQSNNSNYLDGYHATGFCFANGTNSSGAYCNTPDNTTWSESRANNLYLGLTDQRYNESGTINSMNSSWLSTYNQTYHNYVQANVSNSTTFWATVSSYISSWFYNAANVFTFNETKLNNSIDARITGKLDISNVSDTIENINGISSQGLFMYYPLDSNINDYSGNYNTIINRSGSVSYVSSKHGSGYNFSGNNYLLVTVPGNTTSTLTGCAWNQPSQSQNALDIFATRHGDTLSVNGFVVSRNAIDGTAYVLLHNATGGSIYEVSINLPSKYNNLNMQLWCLVVTSTNINVYINGENITNSPSINQPMGTGNTVAIGAAFWGTTHKYNGTIDEVMFWNRSLSQSEIKSLYESNRQLTPLDSYYLIDEPIDTGTNNITTQNIILNKSAYVNNNSKYCLDGLVCSHYITYNGTATIIL